MTTFEHIYLSEKFNIGCTISFTKPARSYFGFQPSFVFAFVASPINSSTSVGRKYSGSTATTSFPVLNA